MYVEKNAYHLATVLKMNEHCSHCGLKYQLEPSFFYGAMYVSYAVNVALAVAVFIVCFAFHLGMKVSFAAIVVVSMLLYPLILRLSRNMYINMFVSYEGDSKK